jgi:signal transduction histidine kinase/ActR/RegA family two-component response regulator
MESTSRALVLTPNEADAELATTFLGRSGIDSVGFISAAEIATAMQDRAGCLVLVEEALTEWDVPILRAALDAQPPWSDLPLIVIAAEVGAFGGIIARCFPNCGNVTLLERPLNAHTLVSAVQVSMRSASRQRLVGDLLEQRENAVKLRDEFLAMLAHELRNPLAPMRNSVFIMQQLKFDNPMVEKTLDVLDRQLTHIARMVDDLMDVARLERGKVALQKKRIDLNVAVGTALESCLPAAQKLGHKVSVNYLPQTLLVDADPVRLEQIVSNLLNNAIKYSPQPGEIRVQTSIEAGQALVSVNDTGIGFDPATAENLFTLFMQGSTTMDRSAGGLGIGLTIVRRLTELHGGSIQAYSAGPNKGSTFDLRLPLVAGAVSTKELATQQTAPARPLRIVAVDDNPDIRETLQMLLPMWGHSVELANDGSSGVACIVRARPDVALVDIGLPGMNGYQVARAVREQDPQRAITLIALTGYGQPADKEMALEAGFDAHLLKPIAPAVLAGILADLPAR